MVVRIASSSSVSRCASHIFPERGHSCPPVGFGVDQRAKADKNVRAPITRANNAGKMLDAHGFAQQLAEGFALDTAIITQ
jgi:hypothetical protein